MKKAQKFHAVLTKFLTLVSGFQVESQFDQHLFVLVVEQKKDGCKERNLLKDIASLLGINPDFTTLWNYRREILIAFKEEVDRLPDDGMPQPTTGDDGGDEQSEPDVSVESTKPPNKAQLVAEFERLCANELLFIENCLKVNRKSYGAWHHRVWLIGFMNNPDLDKEIDLCNQCLMLDERNCEDRQASNWLD